MIYFQDGQRATVWKVEDKGKFAEVKFSTARKDKESGEYKNSTWSYAHFVGEAYKKALNLKEKDRIELKGSGMNLEEYKDKEGNRCWPKNPRIVVFNFEMYTPKDVPQDDNSSPEDEEVPDFLKE
jgi:hypothetical protein